MPYSGIRWQVTDIDILTGKTLVQQSPETTRTIPCGVSVQVIPAHLVYNDADNQLRPCHRLPNSRPKPGTQQQRDRKTIYSHVEKFLSAEDKHYAVKKDRAH
jgi:hypothetical protein